MNQKVLILVVALAIASATVLGAVATAEEAKIAEYFVPPPPFSEGIFPCSQCHEGMQANAERRELFFHTEIAESFNHAKEQRWCLDCHNPDNRDVLRSVSGQLIPFEESYSLCGQCHGTIFRDWKAGIHGKRTGMWNGKKTYRLCVMCHNPHSPRFKPLAPLPPPVNPHDSLHHRASSDEIPKNPIGNLK